MLTLVDVSVPVTDVRAVVLRSDPLVASDPTYAVKTWLAENDIGLRPWMSTVSGDAYRVLGWSHSPAPGATSTVRVGSKVFEIRVGEPITLTGTVIPLRRSSNGGKCRKTRDAADGRESPRDAYKAWLEERLIDLAPFADVTALRVESCRHLRVSRKVRFTTRGVTQKVVREELVPAVTFTLTLTPRDAAAVEGWLLHGVGPQKAFGFGGFFPC